MPRWRRHPTERGALTDESLDVARAGVEGGTLSERHLALAADDVTEEEADLVIAHALVDRLAQVTATALMLTTAAEEAGTGPCPISTAWTASAPVCTSSIVKRHTQARTMLIGEA
ncbi:hypothetical protein [Streptomyces sp. enrichment culture]|uniref:hypothetical protein n=1 Tax=Streptomyces sp. enrichment culture TaxID=1795815 RepID=UPI003F542A1B